MSLVRVEKLLEEHFAVRFKWDDDNEDDNNNQAVKSSLKSSLEETKNKVRTKNEVPHRVIESIEIGEEAESTSPSKSQSNAFGLDDGRGATIASNADMMSFFALLTNERQRLTVPHRRADCNMVDLTLPEGWFVERITNDHSTVSAPISRMLAEDNSSSANIKKSLPTTTARRKRRPGKLQQQERNTSYESPMDVTPYPNSSLSAFLFCYVCENGSILRFRNLWEVGNFLSKQTLARHNNHVRDNPSPSSPPIVWTEAELNVLRSGYESLRTETLQLKVHLRAAQMKSEQLEKKLAKEQKRTEREWGGDTEGTIKKLKVSEAEIKTLNSMLSQSRSDREACEEALVRTFKQAKDAVSNGHLANVALEKERIKKREMYINLLEERERTKQAKEATVREQQDASYAISVVQRQLDTAKRENHKLSAALATLRKHYSKQ